MKPFRGKPEKPERSNGEIQRVSALASGGRVTVGVRAGRSVCRRLASNACTSPLVGRRDPLGAGLRAAVETGWRFGVPLGPAVPGRLARRYDSGAGPRLFASGPSQVRTVIWMSDLAPTSDPPCCWRRCPRTDPDTPVGDALALGTFRTRLETRTKESSMCASHWDLAKPKGVMKVKAALRAPREDAPGHGLAPHSRGVSCSLRAEAHPERTRWDPKDGELCLVRTKSGETLMEVRSDSDVQIDRRNWV